MRWKIVASIRTRSSDIGTPRGENSRRHCGAPCRPSSSCAQREDDPRPDEHERGIQLSPIGKAIKIHTDTIADCPACRAMLMTEETSQPGGSIRAPSIFERGLR